jgi:hypothetical protein
MSIKLGNQDVSKVMLGGQEVSAVYKGADEVWSASSPTFDVQVISGGGGSITAGANGYAYGAGGAGGFREELDLDPLKGQEWNVGIGAGGAVGASGGQSIVNIPFGIAYGCEGGAATGKTPNSGFGGSGSGGRGKLNKGYAGTVGGKYGNDGAAGGGSSTSGAGGAGGGAGAVPQEATGGYARSGGEGVMCWDNVRRAGGGGGSNATNRGAGTDGGGRGVRPGETAGAGETNKGGGAGATCPSGTASSYGAAGGSGVVLIRTSLTPVSISGGSKVGQSEGKNLYRFYTSGSIKF